MASRAFSPSEIPQTLEVDLDDEEPVEEDIDSESLGSIDLEVPDLEGYLGEFEVSDEDKLALCNKYASFLRQKIKVKLQRKVPAQKSAIKKRKI